MGVLQQIWTYRIYGGILLICQNAIMRVYGTWIKRYCVLCSKTYSTSSSLVMTSHWFARKPQGVPASVRLVNWIFLADHLSSHSWRTPRFMWVHTQHYGYRWPGGRFKNTYELLNLRALKFSPVNKSHIFQCLGKIFCVEFQRYPLKFHTKYLTHTLKDMIFIQYWNSKSS